MPHLPSGLIEWLQQHGVQVGAWVFLWYEVKASEARQVKRIDEREARQNKRTDELRADMKDGFEAMARGFAECRADNKALGERLDRLMESLLAAKPL